MDFTDNREKMEKLLKKFQAGPGIMSAKEIFEVQDFLIHYKVIRDLYKSAFVIDPTGLTIESQLKTVDFYINQHRERLGYVTKKEI